MSLATAVWSLVYYPDWFLPIKVGLAILGTACAKYMLLHRYRQADKRSLQRAAASNSPPVRTTDSPIQGVWVPALIALGSLWLGAFWGFGYELLVRGGVLGTLSILMSVLMLALLGVMVEYNLRTQNGGKAPRNFYTATSTPTQAVDVATVEPQTLTRYLTSQILRSPRKGGVDRCRF